MANPFVGKWSYRSWYNDPDLATPLEKLQLGYGEIVIEEGPEMVLTGTIGYAADGWSLIFVAPAVTARLRRCGFRGRV